MRDAQIDKAATEYAKVRTEIGIGIDATMLRSFMAGAKWADSHPKRHLYSLGEMLDIISAYEDNRKLPWDKAIENMLNKLNGK